MLRVRWESGVGGGGGGATIQTNKQTTTTTTTTTTKWLISTCILTPRQLHMATSGGTNTTLIHTFKKPFVSGQIKDHPITSTRKTSLQLDETGWNVGLQLE